MASDWRSGQVFSIGWLILWVPIFCVAMAWFHARKEIQPIKARSPALVIVTDIILLLYMVLLCLQRIISSYYPCLLNLWSGYCGTVILLDTYLWRCWTLYYNFNLTHVRLSKSTRMLGQGGADELISGAGGSNFFIKNRWMTGAPFLSRVMLASVFVLMIPPLALSLQHTSIADQRGDGCELYWGPTVLAIYVAAYVALFSWFSFTLRSVVDGFKIKAELKITGFIALMAVIPWFVFNNYASDLNSNTFPFSTLALLIAIVAAFSCSTVYPLWASIFGGAASAPQPSTAGSGSLAFHSLAHTVPSAPDGSINIERLYQILSDPAGLEAFTQFLKREFSVENIVFYEEIERLRIEIRQAMATGTLDHVHLLQRFRRVHAKYIAVGADFQVNLPDPVVRNCEAHLRYEANLHGAPDLAPAFSASSAGSKKVVPKNQPKSAAAAVPPTGAPSAGVAGGLDSAGIELEDLSAPPPPQQPPMDHLDKTTPTVFDDSQRTIYVLMEKDSMLRFVRSDLYKAWFNHMQEEQHKNQVLAEMNLV